MTDHIITRGDGATAIVAPYWADHPNDGIDAWLSGVENWTGPRYDVGSNAGCPASRFVVRSGELMEVVVESVEGYPCGWHLERVSR